MELLVRFMKLTMSTTEALGGCPLYEAAYGDNAETG